MFNLQIVVLCRFSLFCLRFDAANVKEPEGSLIDISSGPTHRKSKPVASPKSKSVASAKSKPVASPSVCPGGFTTPQHSDEAAQSIAPAGKLIHFL
jgi:hypothetical protein